MSARTCKIVHRNRSFIGSVGERRVPITYRSGAAFVEVPNDWFPCVRAGLAPWREHRRMDDGTVIYASR